MLPWILSAALASVPIPSDVQRCIDTGVMWVADAQSFERLEVHRDGRPQAAVQIVDRFRGHTGYLLLFPRDCRLTVLALSPAVDRATRTATLIPANGNQPTPSETAQLLDRAGHTPDTPENPRLAAIDAELRSEAWTSLDRWVADGLVIHHDSRPLDLAWFDGPPPAQSALWTERPDTDTRRWTVRGHEQFRWGGPWAPGQHPAELDAVVFPAIDGSNLLGLSVYDPAEDAFAWIADLVVSEVGAKAIRHEADHLWALGPSEGPTGWTLYATDLTTGELHRLAFEPRAAAPWREAHLTDAGLVVPDARELWSWSALTELTQPD